MRVELLLAPDCPLADAARLVVSQSTNQLGLKVSVEERVGDFPSPTVLVDGVDVMTGSLGTQRIQACRLDVPTVPRVLEALRMALLTVGVTSSRIAEVAAADRCCGAMNFFATSENAQAWAAEHPDVDGVVLNKEQAFRLGVDILATYCTIDLHPCCRRTDGERTRAKPRPAQVTQAAARITAEALRMVWRLRPRMLIASIGLKLVNGAGLAAALIFGRNLIGSVLTADSAGTTPESALSHRNWRRSWASSPLSAW